MKKPHLRNNDSMKNIKLTNYRQFLSVFSGVPLIPQFPGSKFGRRQTPSFKKFFGCEKEGGFKTLRFRSCSDVSLQKNPYKRHTLQESLKKKCSLPSSLKHL